MLGPDGAPTGMSGERSGRTHVCAPEATGAGDGNRTRMTSLEGWSSTIELRPQRPAGRRTKGNGSQVLIAARHPASRSGRHPRVRARLGFTVSRDVAQFGSASALGAEGRGFESRHPDRAPDLARPSLPGVAALAVARVPRVG